MTQLKVQIQKTELAKKLEKELNISWNLQEEYIYDAGFDLRACIESNTNGIVLSPNRQTIISTGLHFHMLDNNWEIQIRPRSGLAAKYGIMIVNSPGTIDYMYREEVKIILYNSGRNAFPIQPGDRIAQACFREIPIVTFEYVDQIEKTTRGGFGSTGTK